MHERNLLPLSADPEKQYSIRMRSAIEMGRLMIVCMITRKKEEKKHEKWNGMTQERKKKKEKEKWNGMTQERKKKKSMKNGME
jgi:hypothetical protein